MKPSNVIYLSAFVAALVLAMAFAVLTYYPRYKLETAKAEDKHRVIRCLEMSSMTPSRIDGKVCAELEDHYKLTYLERLR